MPLLAVCSAEIDWSATGVWFSGVATFAGVIVACIAMRTWKKQINLQERYQKTDALLRSFILCIRAGHDWQLDCGAGETRRSPSDSEKYALFTNALMDYRLVWKLAHPVVNQCNNLIVHPDRLQSEIIEIGKLLFERSNVFDFECKMQKLMDAGISEIIALRDVK